MKNGPDVVSESSEEPQRFKSLARFWACFLLCLAVLGLVSGLMLVGLFLLMGYRIL